MSDKFEQSPELANENRDNIIRVLQERTGHSHQPVWLDNYNGTNKLWWDILAKADIWERDVVWPLEGPVEMPEELDCIITGEGLGRLKRVDQLNTYEEALCSDDDDLIEKPAAAVLIEGATVLSMGIVHLGRAAINESVGLVKRFTPGLKFYDR